MKTSRAKMGRPRLPESEKKVHKTIYLKPEQWEALLSIDSNPSAAMERLVEINTLIQLARMEEKYSSSR